MGKARKQKTHAVAARAAADGATAVATQDSQPPSRGGTSDGTGATPQVDMKAGVLDGLASLNTLTRESSCAAIASLFEKIDSPEAGTDSWSAAQRLIAGGLVKKLLPRMVDRAPGVKLQATGAMRNISAVRDPRLCELLVHDDCLTPVLTLLDRMSSTPPAAAAAAAAGHGGSDGAAAVKTASSNQLGAMAPEQEVVVMAQLVATLCNLLAAVDVAVGRFTSQGGLQVVMRLLLAEGCRGSPEVFGGALQALHVATDSNVDLACRLAALPGAVDQLSALVRGADVAHVKVSTAMRVQAAGVLVNVAGLSSNAAQTAEGQTHLSGLVLPLLLEQMSYDPAALQQACVALAAATATAVAAAKPEADPESMDVDPDGSAAVSGEEGASKGQGAVEARVAAGVAAAMPMDMATSGAVSADRPPQEAAGGVSSEVSGKVPPGAEDGGEKDVESRTNDAQVAAPDQPDMDAQLRWEWKMGVAEPLKLTAEVMANLCSLGAGETGEGEEDEEEWGSDDEDAMEKAASGGAGQQQQDLKAGGGSAPVVLLDAMAEGRALPRTLATLQALLSPTPRDQDQAVAAGAAAAGAVGGGAGITPPAAEGVSATNRLPLPGGTAGDLADLRATVALCAANLVQNLPERALGESPYGLWTDLCGLCEAAVQRAPSCVETLTGVMWGLARRAGPAVAAGIRASSTASVAPGGAAGFVTDPLHMLLRLCDPEVTRAFEARVNAVGMLGALGSAAAGAGGAPSAAQGDGPELRLGRALVQVMEDPHVLVQAEALNAVMDVYGDDDLDAAFRASGAPEALAAAVPAFRRKVKQEGKVLGRDALCHLKETALNASRFVKYKQAAAGGKGR